jgi:competence protein ComEA
MNIWLGAILMFGFSKREAYVVVLLVFAIISGSGILILMDQKSGKITVTTSFDGESNLEEILSSTQQEVASKNEVSTKQEVSLGKETIFVDVSGAVNKPGVYEMEKGFRVFQAIDCAGGPTEDAFLENLNLAAVLYDAQKIHVPRRHEVSSQGSGISTQYTDKVRINAATVEELQQLPGIGAVLAQRIVKYREQYGPFASVEDIKQVAGIGDKIYQEIKDMLTVY